MVSKSSPNAGPLLEYLSVLDPFLAGEGNTEICINQPGEIFTENRAGWVRHEVPVLDFSRCLQLAKLIATYSQQRLDEQQPILSATLPGGERVQIVIPPATRAHTVSLTIRKPANVVLSLEDYERSGAFEDCAEYRAALGAEERELLELKAARRFREFLALAVATRRNIIVSGATGSGKTTLLRSLLARVPHDERLLSIENVDELKLYHTHANSVSLFYSAGGQGLADISQQHLLESALRMKPDRVFLAELIRGDEAFYYLRNVNSGHPGSITSIHANSARLAIEQLVLFLKESASAGSMSRADIKQLLFLCVDIIVQIKHLDRRRIVTEIYYDPQFQREQLS
jgi:type IV secretion system protein VirB11